METTQSLSTAFSAWSGKTIVIKYGGHAMQEQALQQAVYQDIQQLHAAGARIVIVHGGGPEINRLLEQLQIPSHFVRGLRVTTDAILDIAEMVLVGKLNKQIVMGLQQLGVSAAGFSGKDASTLIASQLAEELGWVGEIQQVHPQLLQALLAANLLPVVAPIATNLAATQGFNVNADIAAGHIAASLQADAFLLLTDVAGVLRDRTDPNSLMAQLTLADVPELIAQEVVKDGMIPKVECCVQAIQAGVSAAHIVDGRQPNCIWEALREQIGTRITAA